MYDWPEIRPFTDELWNGIARHAGLTGPLVRGGNHDALWRDPALIFSQTCGYPFTHEFKGLLKYVATPHYATDGCNGPLYSSFIFAREATTPQLMRGARPAVNSWDSMSGMLALKLVFAPFASNGEYFARALITGSHRESLKAVREGRADLCATDAVCVGLARKHSPQELEDLVEIARSPLVPVLPFVTRAGDVTRLRSGLALAMRDPDLAHARSELLLADVSVLPEDAYDIIPRLESQANLKL
jgi:ABC-type phosphate/phosphonate transport system substrate-binding protein